MRKIFKWLFFTALALIVLLLVAVFGLHRWVNTDDFRQRMERDASAALGVPVAVGSIQVDVWPLPAVALGNLQLQSKPPVTLERLELRPDWQALLQGRLVVSTLIVRKAVLPQQGIDAVLLAMQKKKQAASATASSTTANAATITLKPSQAAKTAPAPAAINVANAAITSDEKPPTDATQYLPRRTVFDDVTWVSNAGTSTAMEGETRLGADALPDSVQLKIIRGNLLGLRAELKREPRTAGSATPTDQWALQVFVGGGKIDGKLGLRRGAASGGASGLAIQGKLETRGVEVGALTAPNKPLTGLIDASTTLQSHAATTAALIDALQTQTSFTVRDATLNGIDLAKAIKSAGADRSGQTKLQTLTGQVSSQGRALQLSNLVASSGVLSATGNVTVSPLKALAGQLSVNLADDSKLGSALGGGVKVPVLVGGTVEKPDVSVSRAGLLGAALGTGAGAKLGEKLGEQLGGKLDGLKGLFGK